MFVGFGCQVRVGNQVKIGWKRDRKIDEKTNGAKMGEKSKNRFRNVRETPEHGCREGGRGEGKPSLIN